MTIGVDFDVRGVVQLAGPEASATLQTFPPRVDGIALPRTSAGLALLMSDFVFHPDMHVALETVIHYRDGGERRQEHSFRIDPIGIHVLIDERGDDEASRGAKVAWLARRRDNTNRLQPPVPIFLVRVDNPEPERELASLSLVARSAPFVLAITALPPAAAKP